MWFLYMLTSKLIAATISNVNTTTVFIFKIIIESFNNISTFIHLSVNEDYFGRLSLYQSRLMNLRKLRIHGHGSSNRLILSQEKFKTIDLSELGKKGIPIKKTEFQQSCDLSSFNDRIQMSKTYNGNFKVNKQPKRTLFKDNCLKFPTNAIKSVPQQRYTIDNCKQQMLTIKNESSLIKNQIKLKSIFSNKPNVKRILKAWNFFQKKDIDLPQFHSILKDKLAMTIQRQEAAQLMEKYSQRKDNTMQSHQFLRLIYGQHDKISFKPQLSQHTKINETKSQQFLKSVNNLSLSSSFYKNCKKNKIQQQQNDQQINSLIKNYRICGSKMRMQYPLLNQEPRQNISELVKKSKRIRTIQANAFEEVTNRIGIEKNLNSVYDHEDQSPSIYDSFFSKRKILQISHAKNMSNHSLESPNLSLTMNNNCKFFNSKSKFSNEIKQSEANPKLLLGVDQRKTRLGATPIYNCKRENSQESCYEVYTNSKQKVDRQLIAEREKERSRYANKLKIIQNNRENQKETIHKLNDRLAQIQLANLNKTKIQRQAYNYVAFINNQWR